MNERRYKIITRRESRARQRNLLKHAGEAVVFVITMASSLVSFAAFGVTLTTIALCAAGLVLLLSLLANALLLYDSRVSNQNVRQIAFLTPSSGDQPFYSAMLGALVRNASLALGQNYVLIPSMPTQSFETVSIWSLFASLEDRQLDIDGIIFIPDDPDAHFEEIVGFHEKRGDVPLVLVDVYFDLDACDTRTQARLPSFVGGDELAGGKLAAEMIVEATGSSPPQSPVALIVNGAPAPWEQQRAKSFRQHLAQAWPGTKFIETPPINYSRAKATEAVLELLRIAADSTRKITLHAVFACNDDMAIGARTAISRLVREGYLFPQPPQIVGYDGIPEIREYLYTGDQYIAGTVDVRIDEQARAAVLLMHKMLRTGQRRTEVQLILPKPVKRA